MRLSRRVIDAYNAAIKKQGGNAEKAANAALRVWFAENPGADIALTRDYAIELMQVLGTHFGQAAGDVAYALRMESADALGVELPDVDYAYAPDPEYVDKTARYQAEKLKNGDVDGFTKAIADASRYFAERGANDTMAALGKADAGKLGKRVRFARVPTGATTCPYCLMLASRGFVYHSELNALNANHRNCDCRIVEGFDGMTVDGYDPDAYYDMWKHPEKYKQAERESAQSEPLISLSSAQYPGKFSNTKGKKQQLDVFLEAVNSVEGADQKVREIYSRMLQVAESPLLPGDFDVKYGAGNGCVSVTSSRSTGDITKLVVKIPKMTSENIGGTYRTTCHELGHFIDVLRGENSDRWFSSGYSDFLRTDYLSLSPGERRQAAQAHAESVKPKGRILALMREADTRYGLVKDRLDVWYKAESKKLSDKYQSVNGSESATREKKLAAYKDYLKGRKTLRREWDNRADIAHREAMGGVEQLMDIYDALNNGNLRGTKVEGVEIRYGHGSRYYSSKAKQIEEIWANYCSLSLTRPDIIELLRQDQPRLVEAMDSMRDDILRSLNG